MYKFYVKAPVTGWCEVDKDHFESFRNHIISDATAIRKEDREKYAARKCIAAPTTLAQKITVLVNFGDFPSVPEFLQEYITDRKELYHKLFKSGTREYTEACRYIRNFLIF